MKAGSRDNQSSTVGMLPPIPYPGLRRFDANEAVIFFGRDYQARQLRERLENRQFVAVVGSSGCGKSSLVNAGLIPTLEAGWLKGTGSSWRFATMRPGDRPVLRLAEAILGATRLTTESPYAEEARIMAGALRSSPTGLIEAATKRLARWQSANPEHGRTSLLLFVDQFEELFRYRSSGNVDEAGSFVSLLVTTIAEAQSRLEKRAKSQQSQSQDATEAPDVLPIYILLTMRSDFLGKCSIFPELAAKFNDSQFLTPRLSRKELNEAIVGPSRVFLKGALLVGDEQYIEEKLRYRLLNDLDAVILSDDGEDAPESDQLPLLQHAMMRMWQAANVGKPSNRPLNSEDYEKIGGSLPAALDQHGERLMHEVSRRSLDRVAQLLFCRLTERFAGRSTRRPTLLRDIAAVAAADALPAGVSLSVIANSERDALMAKTTAEVVEVAQLFATAEDSFLTVSGSALRPDLETVIDITHEALYRSWKRLRAWMDTEAESRYIYERLERSARGYPERESLLVGATLVAVKEWQERERPSFEWVRRYKAIDDKDPQSEERARQEFDQAMTFLADSEEDWEKQEIEEKLAAIAAERERAERAEIERELAVAKSEADLAKSERENERLVAKAEKTRIRTIQISSFASAGVAAIGAGILFIVNRDLASAKTRADNATVVAKAQKTEADTERSKALTSAAIAEAQKKKATIEAVKADREATIAKKNELRANRQESLAKQRLSENESLLQRIRISENAAIAASYKAAQQAKLAEEQKRLADLANNSLSAALSDLRSNELKLIVATKDAKNESEKAENETIRANIAAMDAKKSADAANESAEKAIEAEKTAQDALAANQDLVEALLFTGTTIPAGFENSALKIVYDVFTAATSVTADGHLLPKAQAALTQAVTAAGAVTRIGSPDAQTTALSPDGKYLYSVAADGITVTRKAATGAAVDPTLKFSAKSTVRVLEPSPDGKYLAVVPQTGQIQIFDTTTGQAILSLGEEADRFIHMAFSPVTGHGQQLIGVGTNNVKLWNLPAGSQITLPVDKEVGLNPVVAFAESGELAAICDRNIIRFLDPISGASAGTAMLPARYAQLAREGLSPSYTSNRDAVARISLSHDGSYLTTVTLSGVATIYPVDAPTRGNDAYHIGFGSSLPGNFADARYLPDDQLITADADGTIALWRRSADNGEMRRWSILGTQSETRWLGSVRDDAAVESVPAAIDGSGTATIWSEQSPLKQIPLMTINRCNLAKLFYADSSSGSRVVATTSDGTIESYNGSTWNLEGAFTMPNAWLMSGLLTSDSSGKVVIDPSSHYAVEATPPYENLTGRGKKSHSTEINVYNADLKTMRAPDGAVWTLDIKEPTEVTALAINTPVSSPSALAPPPSPAAPVVFPVVVEAENKIYKDKPAVPTLTCWEAKKGNDKHRWQRILSDPVRELQFAPNGKYCVAVLTTGVVATYSTDGHFSSGAIGVLDENLNLNAVKSNLVSDLRQINNASDIAVSGSSTVIAVGCTDGITYLVPANPDNGLTKSAILTLRPPSDSKPEITAISFFTTDTNPPSDTTVAIGSADGVIRLYQTADSKLTDTYQVHGGHAVTNIAFSPDGKTLLSSDNSGTIVSFKIGIYGFKTAATALLNTGGDTPTNPTPAHTQ